MSDFEWKELGDADLPAGAVGRLGVHRNARELFERHAAVQDPQVRAAQLIDVNEFETARVDGKVFKDSVEDLSDRPIEIDPTSPKVRGSLARDQVVTFVYFTPSGRPARGAIPLDELPDDVLRDPSEVAVQIGDPRFSDPSTLASGMQALRGELEKLRGLVLSGDIPGAGADDGEEADVPPVEPETLDQPWDGYEDTDYRDLIKSLTDADSDVSPETRAEVITYENLREDGPRKTVVEAALAGPTVPEPEAEPDPPAGDGDSK